VSQAGRAARGKSQRRHALQGAAQARAFVVHAFRISEDPESGPRATLSHARPGRRASPRVGPRKSPVFPRGAAIAAKVRRAGCPLLPSSVRPAVCGRQRTRSRAVRAVGRGQRTLLACRCWERVRGRQCQRFSARGPAFLRPLRGSGMSRIFFRRDPVQKQQRLLGHRRMSDPVARSRLGDLRRVPVGHRLRCHPADLRLAEPLHAMPYSRRLRIERVGIDVHPGWQLHLRHRCGLHGSLGRPSLLAGRAEVRMPDLGGVRAKS
jgi:hypothetical protein